MGEIERIIEIGQYFRQGGAWTWIPNSNSPSLRKIRDLEKENDNLRGHIRRLEKSNQALGEENHRLKNPIAKGWD